MLMLLACLNKEVYRRKVFNRGGGGGGGGG